MAWGSLVLAVMKLATALFEYAERRSLIRQGQIEQIAKEVTRANALIFKANSAARAVSHDASSVRDDRYNRDRAE